MGWRRAKRQGDAAGATRLRHVVAILLSAKIGRSPPQRRRWGGAIDSVMIFLHSGLS
jgi:hypothetical protein